MAVIENMGRFGARIIAIAPDRAFGDALVSSVEAAREVCVRAGLEIREWDRETDRRPHSQPQGPRADGRHRSLRRRA